MSSNPEDISKNIDSAVATYGRAKTYLNTFIGTIIFICFIILGIYLVYSSYSNRKNIKSTNATIVSIAPYEKNLFIASITYNIDNKEYKTNITLKSFRNVGSNIIIYYDINNPNNVSESSNLTTAMIGSGMISFALLLCIFMFYYAFLVQKSDVAAIDAALPKYIRYNPKSY
jgi:uncharacterized membrane protein YukC